MLFGGAYDGRRVLVTGFAGFKGSWLTAWLCELGAEVCGYFFVKYIGAPIFVSKKRKG